MDDIGMIWMHIEDLLVESDIDMMTYTDHSAPTTLKLSWLLCTTPRRRAYFPRKEFDEMKEGFSPISLPERESDKEVRRELESKGVPLGDCLTIFCPGYVIDVYNIASDPEPDMDSRMIRAGYRVPHDVAFEWATRIALAREMPGPSSLDDNGMIWIHIEDTLVDYDVDIMPVSDSNAPPHRHSWLLGTSSRKWADFTHCAPKPGLHSPALHPVSTRILGEGQFSTG
ncbi:hypothetical protein BD626DRAFT_571419 [Schizophyllum amplum]|uniref:Uncharacterized protein n=1 Tax=Schizophyllum amplum TaxID=97359 RepID=A0A550C7C9_9AGAR|nr:hypothetical protein BD626DRAFT_571419 [Auriculariopsis ampla]